jgi:hypothetical protein
VRRAAHERRWSSTLARLAGAAILLSAIPSATGCEGSAPTSETAQVLTHEVTIRARARAACLDATRCQIDTVDPTDRQRQRRLRPGRSERSVVLNCGHREGDECVVAPSAGDGVPVGAAGHRI